MAAAAVAMPTRGLVVAAPAPLPPAAAIETLLRTLSASSVAPGDQPLLAMVTRFYDRRAYAAAWTDSGGLTPAGHALHRAIGTAAEEGLDAQAYPRLPITAASPEARARADVRLSLVALRFARDLGWGVTVPGEVQRDHEFAPRPFRGDSLLQAWLEAPDAGRALVDVAPRSPEYQGLRDALRQLRSIDQRGGWSAVSRGPTLRVGAAGLRVRALRRALRERGDLVDAPDAPPDDLFDEALAAAVARFQERHGLVVDSVCGSRTVAALEVPASARAAQVQLGMERARWLPAVTGDRWITVNLADYRVSVMHEGVAVYQTRAVIGDTKHQTPMFVDTLTNIVFNPAWNVPPSIAAQEILPRLRRDPSYLERQHMVRIGADIQQLPGPWNALGEVAFVFPNRFNVYMHDTPAKELFEAPDRAHSHGCIRVQYPRTVAELLLAPDAWSPARIDSVIATGRRTVIWLRKPVPVHITYTTAFASPDGALQFRPDVYRRDALLQRAVTAAQTRPLPDALS